MFPKFQQFMAVSTHSITIMVTPAQTRRTTIADITVNTVLNSEVSSLCKTVFKSKKKQDRVKGMRIYFWNIYCGIKKTGPLLINFHIFIKIILSYCLPVIQHQTILTSSCLPDTQHHTILTYAVSLLSNIIPSRHHAVSLITNTIPSGYHTVSLISNIIPYGHHRVSLMPNITSSCHYAVSLIPNITPS